MTASVRGAGSVVLAREQDQPIAGGFGVSRPDEEQLLVLGTRRRGGDPGAPENPHHPSRRRRVANGCDRDEHAVLSGSCTSGGSRRRAVCPSQHEHEHGQHEEPSQEDTHRHSLHPCAAARTRCH